MVLAMIEPAGGARLQTIVILQPQSAAGQRAPKVVLTCSR